MKRLFIHTCQSRFRSGSFVSPSASEAQRADAGRTKFMLSRKQLPRWFVSTPFFLQLAPLVAMLAVLLANGCSSTSQESQAQVDKRIAAERAKSAKAFKESIVSE